MALLKEEKQNLISSLRLIHIFQEKKSYSSEIIINIPHLLYRRTTDHCKFLKNARLLASIDIQKPEGNELGDAIQKL